MNKGPLGKRVVYESKEDRKGEHEGQEAEKQGPPQLYEKLGPWDETLKSIVDKTERSLTLTIQLTGWTHHWRRGRSELGRLSLDLTCLHGCDKAVHSSYYRLT